MLTLERARVFSELYPMPKPISNIKATFVALSPWQSLGTGLPCFHFLSSTRGKRLTFAGIFYSLSLFSALLLFNNYESILTTQKLLTSNPTALLEVLLQPVAFFALTLLFLTLGIAVARTTIPLFIFPLLFLAANPFKLASLLASLLILVGFLAYYYQFLKNINDLKRPIMSQAFNSSLVVLISLLSLAITVNYYNGFSARIAHVSVRLGSSVSQRFNFIINDFDSETSKTLKNETLREHAIGYLTAHKMPLNEAAITLRQRQLVTGLGLATAKSTDDYRVLLDKAIKHQVSSTINTYHKLLSILVPFVFFFVTDVLANVSSNITWVLLLLTERGLLRKARLDLVTVKLNGVH
jgi:hypothetical protein